MPLDTARALRRSLAPRWSLDSSFQWGKVAAVHGGGVNTVDVYLDGSSQLTTGLHYLSSYSPVVNDVVMVARMQGASQTARVVLGKLA